MKFTTAKKRATKAPVNDSASCGYCGFAGTTGAVLEHFTDGLTCPKRALRCSMDCKHCGRLAHLLKWPVLTGFLYGVIFSMFLYWAFLIVNAHA